MGSRPCHSRATAGTAHSPRRPIARDRMYAYAIVAIHDDCWPFQAKGRYAVIAPVVA